jgi:hypothetical protein
VKASIYAGLASPLMPCKTFEKHSLSITNGAFKASLTDVMQKNIAQIEVTKRHSFRTKF